MSPDAVKQMIENRFDSLSPELQRAARWVSRHGAALALHSMRDSARAASVTPATMTRLAQRLGFDGFEALRAPFRRQLAGNGSGAEFDRVLQQRRSGAHTADVLGPLNALQQANVASVTGLNRNAEIEAAAQTLIDAAQVSFVGLRVCHGVAFYLAYSYGLLRPNGHLVTGTGGTFSDQVANIDSRGVLVAVSHSPYTRHTVEAVAMARERGAALVALTDSPLSPLAREARHVLLYDTASNATFHSTAGAQALAEALIAVVAARGGEATRQHLQRMQQQLRSARAYWERPERERPAREVRRRAASAGSVR
jgi:DNA-binding MurR/RpiR family transcriptional regulator